jgi:hypothetical protein
MVAGRLKPSRGARIIIKAKNTKGEKYEIKNPFTVNVGSGNGLAAQHFTNTTSSCRRSA